MALTLTDVLLDIEVARLLSPRCHEHGRAQPRRLTSLERKARQQALTDSKEEAPA